MRKLSTLKAEKKKQPEGLLECSEGGNRNIVLSMDAYNNVPPTTTTTTTENNSNTPCYKSEAAPCEISNQAMCL